MSRKRKEPPQSSTLFSFFGNGGNVSDGISKAKPKAKKRVDNNENGHESNGGASISKLGFGREPEEERWKDVDIIVIESDEEEGAEGQSGDASSGVEVISVADVKPRAEQRAETETERNGEGEGNSRITGSHTHASGLGPKSAENSPPENGPRTPDIEQEDEWELNMDVEFALEGLHHEDSCEDFTLQLDEHDERIGKEDNIKSCPMCSATFLDMDPLEIQTHVNTCLDGSPTNPRPSPPIRKPLRPLSSFPVSAEPSSASTSTSTPDVKPKTASAFSILMSGNAQREREAWAEAQKAEDKSFRSTKNERRKAPFYKILTGMPIAVDAFRYGSIPGVEAYFLTHAHSDHYTNLSSNWKSGPIYCSETTANLIVKMLSVDRNWLHPLPMNTPVEIPKTGGVKVTLIDANHCPGSCIMLFEGRQTVNAGDSTYKSPFVGTSRTFRYLHCGDFRATPQHALHPAVKGKRLDVVYLDTTYLNPKYCFPPQPLVVSACAELARRIVNGEPVNGEMDKDGNAGKGSIQGWMKVDEGKGKQKDQGSGDVLVAVGTYSIGKERVVKAIAKILNTKVYCDARKRAILLCQDDPELHALLTDKPLEAGVHVVPLGTVAADRFKEYMERWNGRWSRAVAFRPTGWTYTPPIGSDSSCPSIARLISTTQSRPFTHAHLKPTRNSTPTLMSYGVPYSEHSSFLELACFVLSVDCARVVATVNVGSAGARAKMTSWIEKWEGERKRRKEVGLPGVVEYRHPEYW